jgi:starch phosphorylase
MRIHTMPHTAYFSAEIGFSSNIPSYSGGLGILAGDHLKAAADAHIPLVGVTLLYQQGYFRQHLTPEGWQQESYPTFLAKPLLTLLPHTVSITLQGEKLDVAIWHTTLKGVHGYEVPVLFLDTHLPQNTPEQQTITQRLYGGDHHTRILQEAVLGFAGLRAVRTLFPQIHHFHLNEGHTAFVPLALLHEGWSPEQVKQACHFTTHTPVPAGHDVFDYGLAQHVLGNALPENISTWAGPHGLSMTHLALHLSRSCNAVSELHGRVTRDMFPHHTIQHITNGVHHLTWTSEPMAALFDKNLPTWRTEPHTLKHALQLPPQELLHARSQAKQALITYVNAETGAGFSPNILTLGFARRAATYKRATLLFRDIERLLHIGTHTLQCVFAGKAHPRDTDGHHLIQDIVRFSQTLGDKIRIAFIPNYNMWLGALITSGVDVWLNTPLRPHEASGTSGMKAALNGVPSLSIADGWWAEAAHHDINGWVVGNPHTCNDDADAHALYNILEHHVIPTYYQNQEKWVGIMKQAIRTSAHFTAARMVQEYHTLYNTSL